MKDLKDYVRSIPDFPSKGIIFRDITTILQDKDALKLAIDEMQKSLENVDFDVVVAAESRGFILGMPIAYNLNKAYVKNKKKGKLPYETISESYNLEYGTATLEIHKDSIKPGQKVVVIDDLIATGGTIEAMIKLVERLGGKVVKVTCLIDLPDLKGKERLKNYDISTVMEFEGE